MDDFEDRLKDFECQLNRRKEKDWLSYGTYFTHYNPPPPIDLEKIEIFKDSLLEICQKKITEALRFYDYFELRKINTEEKLAIKKWIIYWQKIKRIILGQNLGNELNIEQAKQYSFLDLMDHPKRRSGGKSFYLCPFHNEKTPSFCVFELDNHARCFGCSWAGDVIDFVMAKYNLGFVDAVRRLCE